MDISCSCPSALRRTFDVSRAVKEHSDSLTELRDGVGGAQPTAEHVFEEEKREREDGRVRVRDRLMILDMGKLDNFRGKVGRRCNAQ